MANRLELHEVLCELLTSKNVYFQPPESVKMQYRAIVYRIKDVNIDHADNFMYRKHNVYEITLIDKDPDSIYVEKLIRLPYCSFDRFYIADNLNHWTFTLYW